MRALADDRPVSLLYASGSLLWGRRTLPTAIAGIAIGYAIRCGALHLYAASALFAVAAGCSYVLGVRALGIWYDQRGIWRPRWAGGEHLAWTRVTAITACEGKSGDIAGLRIAGETASGRPARITVYRETDRTPFNQLLDVMQQHVPAAAWGEASNSAYYRV